MEETNNKKNFIKVKEKISEHKTEIIIIGSVAVATIASLIFIDNLQRVKGTIQQAPTKKQSIEKMQSVFPSIEVHEEARHVFPVNAFVRKLPVGYKASETQKTKAETLGIVLDQSETFVNAHTRSRAA